MPRPKFIGIIAIIFSIILGGLFAYSIFNYSSQNSSYTLTDLNELGSSTYYALVIPIAIVAFFVIWTGFWIGWTILSIKVVPPMPDIVDKKDLSKIKAFLLCIVTLAAGGLLAYGIFIRSFWSLAIPAAAIALVILGAIFWVGVAIVTTRTTLPEHRKEQ
jgi:hypothetical protein